MLKLEFELDRPHQDLESARTPPAQHSGKLSARSGRGWLGGTSATIRLTVEHLGRASTAEPRAQGAQPLTLKE